jgi:hypothetical protein
MSIIFGYVKGEDISCKMRYGVCSEDGLWISISPKYGAVKFVKHFISKSSFVKWYQDVAQDLTIAIVSGSPARNAAKRHSSLNILLLSGDAAFFIGRSVPEWTFMKPEWENNLRRYWDKLHLAS